MSKTKKPLEGFAKLADKIVGDYVFGTIGYAAFHVGQIPGVKATGAYIGENIADGYNEAEQAKLRRAMASEVVKISKDLGSELTADQIRLKAEKYGIKGEDLDKVKALVANEFAPKQQKNFPTPGIPAAVA